MSVAFNPDTIAGYIANVSISGVTVCDIDQIPQGAQMVTPILFPQPEGWLSDVSQGPRGISVNDAEQSDFTYILHYVFLLAPLGSGISQTEPYNSLVSKLKTIIQTLMSDDTLAGLVDISFNGLEGFGEVEDPSGVHYWGALPSFRITEYP